jgi:hypothetical protein
VIPSYPEFAPLSLEHQADFAALLKPFPPYSDFHFSGMWFWDTDNTTLVSELNGNLVLIGPDYVTGEPVISFMGTEAPLETAECLFAHAADIGVDVAIQRVPEVVVEHLPSNANLIITEEPNNHDYVLSVEATALLAGSERMELRQDVGRFRRHCDDRTSTVELDLTDNGVAADILGLFDQWAAKDEVRLAQSKPERQALRRLLGDADRFDLVASGVKASGHMVGFYIVEVLHDGWSVGHFTKADTSFRGIYAHLLHSQMVLVEKLGSVYCNIEQDLGLPSLRSSKRRLAPVTMLRKFTIRPS